MDQNIFASQHANFACYMLACNFRLVDLATGETGKQGEQAPAIDVGKTMLANIASKTMQKIVIKSKNVE